MQELDRSEFFVVTRDDEARVVRFERTPAAFPSVEVAEQHFQRLLALVERTNVSNMGLLVDSRSGPGRNDEAFERMIGRYRDAMFAPFARCAMLLRTQVGLMQNQRLSREYRVRVAVFQDEAQAIQFLQEGLR